MPNVSFPSALPTQIEQLLSQRKHHSEALATIESTLARVTAALGMSVPAGRPATAPKKRGRPFKNPAAALKAPSMPKLAMPKLAMPKLAMPKVAKPKAARRTRTGMTANEFVLAFVGSKKTATSQEINAHWKESGRLGTADNSLSLLTKDKKLKRTKFTDGTRGSTYTLP